MIFKKGYAPMKKQIIALAALLCLAVPGPASAADPVPLRGIVEGFYGTPWSQENRLDMLAFCHQEGLNAYIYAPKDDPYHRDKWREPYPPEKLQELSALIKEAERQQVKFIFAVSPGLDLHFSGAAGLEDRLTMKTKLEAMYDLGVRDFAIFFDDIKEKDGRGQAEFLNWLEENFVKSHRDISPLITVPTEYHLEDMVEKEVPKAYTQSFRAALAKDILVLYTGNRVVPDGLSDEDYQRAKAVYGNKLGLWWNYPVSDYREAKLALGPVEKLPRVTLPAIFFNPMKHAELSKISLATGAAYAGDPGKYRAEKAWRQALKKICGPLAEDMAKFADHSQHMENDWAKIGPADGVHLKVLAAAYWRARARGQALEARQELDRELENLTGSLDRLLASLPPELLAESRPQIEQLRRIAAADRLGLALLSGEGSKKDFAAALKEVKAHDEEALVSEASARKLLEEIEAALR